MPPPPASAVAATRAGCRRGARPRDGRARSTRDIATGAKSATHAAACIVIPGLARLAECSTTPREFVPWTFRSWTEAGCKAWLETSGSRFILIYATPFLSIRNASSRASLHPGRRSRPRAPTIAANVSSPRTKGRVPHDAPPRAGCAYLAAVARTISPRGLTAVHDARARAFDRRAPGEPFALTRRKTRSATYPIPSRGSARCP